MASEWERKWTRKMQIFQRFLQKSEEKVILRLTSKSFCDILYSDTH